LRALITTDLAAHRELPLRAQRHRSKVALMPRQRGSAMPLLLAH
jgi:hypothetical protein